MSILEDKYVPYRIKVNYEGTKIQQVMLPWKPEEWVDICNSDGDAFPSCCGVISDIRDKFIEALRNGGYMYTMHLEEIINTLEDHGFVHDETNPQFNNLWIMWDAIKEDARHDPPHTQIVDSLRTALSDLSFYATNMWWDFISNENAEGKPNCIYGLNKITPTIGTLYRKLQELQLPTIEGWGMFKGDEIVYTLGGLGIYSEESLCDDAIKQNNGAFTKRKVRLTLEKGLEFLD